MPEISIVVPIYNTENRIGKCIESILAQTYTDFELILINDGSTDRSLDVCKSYEKKDKRILLFDRENSGVSASRNFGISVATGKYLMFCDSDDTVEKDWCQNLYKAIIAYPHYLINCGIIREYSEDESVSVMLDGKSSHQILELSQYYLIYKLGLSGSIWNKIFSLNTIRKKEIYFNESLCFAEDVKFCCDYIDYCDKIYFINLPLYNYYCDDMADSLTKRYYSNYYDLLKLTYDYRKHLIAEEYEQAFYQEFFYRFSSCLENTFDKRNKQSLLKKLKYNQYIINDDSFVEVVNNIKISVSDERFAKMLKKGNYFPIYLSRIKKKLLELFSKNKL